VTSYCYVCLHKKRKLHNFRKPFLRFISVLTGKLLKMEIFSFQISFCRQKARGLRAEKIWARRWNAAGNRIQQSGEAPSLEVGILQSNNYQLLITFLLHDSNIHVSRRDPTQKLLFICHVRFSYILLRIVGATVAQGTILCFIKHRISPFIWKV